MTGDPVRDEAERLVAAAIAAVSLAARGLGGVAGGRPGQSQAGFATGSPECCVCPVCRAISAMRDPNPELAERLAAGAGDLAAAVTGILRSVGKATRPDGGGASERAEGDEFWDRLRRQARDAQDESGADPWRTATTAPMDDLVTGAVLADAPPPPPMAKKAVKKAAPKSAAPKAAAPKSAAKKAAAKKATKKAPPAGAAQ